MKTFSIFAADKEPILFNLSTMNMIVTGSYSDDGKRGGLTAETEARNNAISFARGFIEQSCLKPLDNWRQAFRSDGSEFFPNKKIKVSLLAPTKSLFNYQNKIDSPSLKTKSGQAVVFRFPKYVPASAFSCGVLKLKLAGTVYDVVPRITSLSDAKIIEVIDYGHNVFQVKDGDDTFLRDERVMPSFDEKAIYLPIAVK